MKKLKLLVCLLFLSLPAQAEIIQYSPTKAGGSGSVTSVTFTGDGTVLSSTPSSAVTTSGTLTATLATQTANTVLGALTATTPSGLSLPSCSTSTSALSYTSGTGFGCQTFGTAATASTGTSGANLGFLNGANTYSGVQTYTNSDIALLGSSTGKTTFTSGNSSATNYTLTIPANTGTLSELNLAQTWTAAQTFNNSDIVLLGSSTGGTTLSSANAGATNYTLTLPAITDTVTTNTAAQTLTNKTLTSPSTSNLSDSSGITTPNLNGGQFAGTRNMIMNGDMRVDQRNSGSSQTITAGAALAYTVDQWFAYSTGANVTGQQVAGADGQHAFVYKFTGASSVTGIYFGQRIIATDSAWVAGNSVTLSFETSNSALTSMTCALSYANSTNSWGTVASPAVTSIGSNTFTISSTMTKYSYTFSNISSSATTGLQVLCNVGAQTSGNWQITNMQLELGTQATPFERVRLSDELFDLEKYYASGAWRAYSTSTYVGGLIYYPNQMFCTPSFSFTDNASNASKFSTSSGNNISISAGGISSISGVYAQIDAVLASSASNWAEVLWKAKCEL